MGVLRRSLLLAASFGALLLCVAVLSATSASGATSGVAASPRLDVMQVVDGEVLDSAVIGDRVVLVGTFTKVKNVGGNEINQPYIAAYNMNTGRFDGNFRPTLNKPAYAVDTDATAVYIGGNFSTINGETHRKIAKLTAAGGLVSSFDPQASANVNDVAVADGKVYLAGRFNSIDGQTRTAFAAVNASTGNLDSTVNFDFTFSVQSGGGISGKSIAITPDNSKLFLSHTARFIDGQERTALARFNISANSAALSTWQTNLYDDELDRFGGALRPRRIAVSPDGSYVVMVTSGGDRPPAGDTAVKFPVNSGSNTQADWVSRHFDTVLGVAISNDTVFVGGHFQFQEAPGSTDPFPGDKFTNYGFGFGQGPAQLGSEVVARQQLGALDPATGKSLNWNPGSDSFLGPQSLTFVPGKGLLIGHDGDRLGGANVGRHAFFPLGNDDPAPPPGDGYACTRSSDGTTAVLTFSGNRGESEQLRRNGKWAGTVTGQTTQRITDGVGDDFAVRVRGAGFDDPYSTFSCIAGGGNPGGVTLQTSITEPGTGAVVPAGNITVTGEASAPSGIKRIRLTIIRKADGRYLNQDGSFTASWAPVDIDLNTTDESRTWSTTVNLDQSGEYNITAKTFANDGSKDATRAEGNFIVGSTDDDPPTLTVTGPANPTAGTTAVIEGLVTDDIAVQSVVFTMRDRDKNLYLREDGSLGQSFAFSTSLSNPGGTTSSFERTLTGVPVGEWELVVDAFDSSGQRFRRFRRFAQVGNTSPPSITVVNGAGDKGPADSRFLFSGTAEADAGIENVSILIRDVVDYSGVGANGNLGLRANYFVIPGTNGGKASSWSYESPQLAAGTYDVFVRVTDTLGVVVSERTFVTAGPAGDALPTQSFTGSLRYQQGVDSLTTTIGGSASDDQGVSSVTVQIFDFTRKVWLQTDGTVDSIPDPFVATLNSPGAGSTGWSFTLSAPAPGTYYYYVRAVDSAGQASNVRTFGSGRLYPGDAQPTVNVTTPSNNQTLPNQRIAVSGSANDDNALQTVQVLFRNVDTGDYLRADGTLGQAQWIDSSLTNPGASRSNFDFQTPVAPKGTWVVSIRARDNVGQTTSPSTSLRVTLD